MKKNTAGINEPIWDSRNSDEPAGRLGADWEKKYQELNTVHSVFATAIRKAAGIECEIPLTDIVDVVVAVKRQSDEFWRKEYEAKSDPQIPVGDNSKVVSVVPEASSEVGDSVDSGLKVENAIQEIKDLFARYGSGDYTPTDHEKAVIELGLHKILTDLNAARLNKAEEDSKRLDWLEANGADMAELGQLPFRQWSVVGATYQNVRAAIDKERALPPEVVAAKKED